MTTDTQKLARVRELGLVIHKHEQDHGSLPAEVEDLWNRAMTLELKGAVHNALVLMNKAVQVLVGEPELT